MKRKLRLQFSLKGFLLVVTGSCIIFGNWASSVHRQRDAVDAMLRAGCTVTYDYNPDTTPMEEAIWVTRGSQRSFLFDVLHSPTCVDVGHGGDCAKALAQIKYLPTICDIEIYAAVKDRDLVSLKGWWRPRYLGIWGVTDREFACLPDLNGLQILCLDCTDVTDSSIRVITKLKTLCLLSALRTRLTAAGLATLNNALPKCSVTWLPVHKAFNPAVR